MPKRLAILLAVFLGLALFYSVIIPIFEGPDEDDHFRYAKFIADTGALPVQLFEAGGGAAGHQGWQPPLYYSLAALVIRPIDTSDFQQHLWRNDAATFVGDPACCGRNIYYHTASEDFPYSGTTLAVHLARLLSILFGAVTVWATYQIASALLRDTGLPYPDWLSLAAAAFVAFNPSFLFASALVSNDAPLAALSSLVLLTWVKLLGEAGPHPNPPLGKGREHALGPDADSIPLVRGERRRNESDTDSLPLVRGGLGRGESDAGSLPLVRGEPRRSESDAGSLPLVRGGPGRGGPRELALLPNGRGGWADGVVLGLFLSLAILVKTSAIGLVPISVLVLAVAAWRRGERRTAILGNLAMLIVIALVSGWWFVRNQILYGDPLAYRLMLTSAIFPRAGPLTLPEFFNISLPWMWQTFWGGPTPGDFSPVLLLVLAAITAMAALGFVVYFLRPLPFAVRSSTLFLAACLALIFVAQVQFIRTTTGADQGRYMFPAVSALALFFVVGLAVWAAAISRAVRRLSALPRGLSPAVVLGLFLLAIFVPFAYTLPAYAKPALAGEQDLARVQHPLEVNFANQIELRGYDLDARSAVAGGAWRITLYWQALAPMQESDRIFVHLVGANNYVAGGSDVIPARGAFPTVYWKPGDALRDTVDVAISPTAPPGKYSIEVGLYPAGRPGDRLAIAGSGDQSVLADSIKIAARQPVVYAPQSPLDANFSGKAKLIGYDSTARPDGLSLILYWRDLASFDRDYTVFVHALDASGNIIAQDDHQPQKGYYPTSIWAPGDEIRDEYALAIPPSAQAPTYRVEIGLYRPDTGERLPVALDGGSQDHVDLNLPGTAQ